MGKCSKDKRDLFYRLAKEEGWRARSAFKLLQIDDQFGIFDGVLRAVDLCAAPGSWSQVLAKKLGERSSQAGDQLKIVSVDIQTIAPIEGVTLIQGDITSQETAERIVGQFEGLKAQLVVCDGAPDVTGQHDLDEFIQSQLILAALNITSLIIESGGTFVAKIFRGEDITLMIAQLRIFFKNVHVAKPRSSRASSIESFVVCSGYATPIGYRPQMFDLSTSVGIEPSSTNDRTLRLVPFLKCGDLNSMSQNQKNKSQRDS